MRELILTHLIGNQAIIALVDYEKFEASVKKMELKDASLETGDLSELIKSGKLIPYRKLEHIDLSKDAWLAFHPDKGCLVVDCRGTVYVRPASQYLPTLQCWVYTHSLTIDDLYRPKILGEVETSFYKVLKEAEKKYGASLEDERVRHELMNKLGIGIAYTPAGSTWNKFTTIKLNLYGKSIDKLELPKDAETPIIHIDYGNVGEIWIDAEEAKVEFDNQASVDLIKLSHRVRDFACRATSANYMGHPVLTTDAETCDLEHLEGYCRGDADLSMFKKLRTFRHCWRNYNKEKPLVLNLKLNDLKDKEFEECFIGVDIQTILPYADGSGTLDLTGIYKLRECFHNFTGLNHICGRVTEDIVTSFFSEEFAGTFDVTMRMVVGSFAHRYKDRASHYTSLEEKPLKYNPKGVLRLEVPDGVAFNYAVHKDSSTGKIDLGTSGKYTLIYWEQEQHLVYANPEETRAVRKLHIDTDKSIEYHIHVGVTECAVSGWWSSTKEKKDPIFHKEVGLLSRGRTPYPNVCNYGDKCFSNVEFKPTYIVQPDEKLRSIGARAFYATKGIEYFVIPKSCKSIGAAAFSEMKSMAGTDLTTICVYRDSYAHSWSKGKNLRIKVIDSIDDIPKQASKETDSDFLAVFVDTPDWAINSKAFVAKVLLMQPVDIMNYIKPVAKLSADLDEFFKNEYASKPRTKVDSKGEEKRTDLYGDSKDGFPPETEVSRLLLHAATLEAIYGSNLELLDKKLLSRFAWTPKICYDVTHWEGTALQDTFYGATRNIHIYIKDGEVYYVGCGSLREKAYTSLTTSGREVLSADNLMGADVYGRLALSSGWGGNGFNLRVHGDYFSGDAAKKFKDFMFNSMVFVGVSSAAKSGRVQVKENDIYDIINDKIYRFSSSNEDLGVYKGEVDKADYHDKEFVKRGEASCLIDSTIEVKKAQVAPPAFELEFCRKHPKFDLYGKNPKVEQMALLLSKSGFVKKITQSVFENKIDPRSAERKLLADGTRLFNGPATNGYTNVLLIQMENGKTVGFEAAFDMLKFIETMDYSIQGRKEYPEPNRGYMNIVSDDDLFAVSTLKPTAKSGYYYGSSDDRKTGLYIAFDLKSGKLVLAYGESYTTYIIFSFESGKDARDFYTEFGSKIFAPPEEYFESCFRSTMYNTHIEGQGTVALMHPHQSHARIANSVLALGDRKPQPESTFETGLYSLSILKYGRI